MVLLVLVTMFIKAEGMVLTSKKKKKQKKKKKKSKKKAL